MGFNSYAGQKPAPRLDIGKKPRAKPSHDEHIDQCAFFEWVRMDPRTRDLLIYSVPNSALAGSTPRDRYRMVRAVQEGLLKGMPDICVDEPRGEYHGLRIEMKRDKRNKDGSRPVDVLPSVDQLAIHEKLRANGYAVQVCYGTVDAMKALCNYLGIVPPT